MNESFSKTVSGYNFLFTIKPSMFLRTCDECKVAADLQSSVKQFCFKGTIGGRIFAAVRVIFQDFVFVLRQQVLHAADGGLK